jgi:hypothetical protein
MAKETENLIKACVKLKNNYAKLKGNIYTKGGFTRTDYSKIHESYLKAHSKFRDKFGYEKPLPKKCRFTLGHGKVKKY